MGSLRFIFALMLGLTVPLAARAEPVPLHRYAAYGRVINAATLDASSTTFSVDISQPDQRGVWSIATLWLCVTDADNSVTAITLAMTASRDNGTTDYSLQDCSLSSGTCTSSNSTWVKNPSAMTSPKCWVWRIDTEGFAHIEGTVTDTGGTADDSLTAYVTFGIRG